MELKTNFATEIKKVDEVVKKFTMSSRNCNYKTEGFHSR